MAAAESTQWLYRPDGRAHVLAETDPPRGVAPILRGRVLSVLSEAVVWSPFIQKTVWQGAGFGVLRNSPKLVDVHPRLDPTVIRHDASARVERVQATRELLAEDWSSRRAAKPFPSVLDYHEAYKSGALSPVDVTEALLPLIQRGPNPAKHSTAFLETRADLVRQAAIASAARYKQGKPLSPLDGVPVVVKDEVDLKGYKRCLGSKLDLTNPADLTTVCVERWEDAGAVIVGKSNMHELGLDTTTNNPNYGTPVNPYNGSYYCGGSSGGSSYVLGAGLVPVAHGADGGGSIRIPSSSCGVYGLKPSHNRISGRPTPSLATSVGVHGPMAANMVDLEICYRIMAQPDMEEATAALFVPPRSIVSIKKRDKLLGIDYNWLKKADPPVRDLFDQAVKWLTQKRGYRTIDITLPVLHEAQLGHAISIVSEISAGVPDISKLTAANRILMTTVGDSSSSVDLLQAQKARKVLMEHLAGLYNANPDLIIVTPTTPNAGWEIMPGDLSSGLSNGNMSIKSMTYVFLANFVGTPAITAPVGYAPTTNVPIGLMGMGDWCSEDNLLAFGYDLETYLHNELQGGRQKPQNWVDVLELAKQRKA